MKQTAGTLRLDLAQYRELEAFSQFASDLDETTQKQLERGQRLMEVIKQGVLDPLPVVKQVSIIYAGVNGFLDDVPVDKVEKFENTLFDCLDSHYVDFVKLFNKENAMTDEVKTAIDKLLNDFKERHFKP